MAHMLKDIEVDEVSLVDTPANQDASVVIYKRAAPVSKSGSAPLPTLLSQVQRSLPNMSTVAKRHDETGVISFRKSANSDETVEVRKEDYGDAMEMAGEDADDSITPVMEMLHQTVQQVVAADAAPEEKAAAITKSFQEAMMLLGEGINGTDEEPGLIEKCLITGAVLVQKFGQVEKTAEGSQDNTTGGAGEEVKKGNDDMANDAEVAELRKKLADMEDRNRLTEIKDELRKAGIPLENADVLLKLEKSDKAAAEQLSLIHI